MPGGCGGAGLVPGQGKDPNGRRDGAAVEGGDAAGCEGQGDEGRGAVRAHAENVGPVTVGASVVRERLVAGGACGGGH